MLARIINPLFPKSVNWKTFATKIAKIVKIDRLIEVKFVIPPIQDMVDRHEHFQISLFWDALVLLHQAGYTNDIWELIPVGSFYHFQILEQFLLKWLTFL